MVKRIIIIDDDEEFSKGKYKKMSASVNRFYARKAELNLPGLARFDEPKGKWKPVLKRKWY